MDVNSFFKRFVVVGIILVVILLFILSLSHNYNLRSNYPVIECINNVENSIDVNSLPFTAESQRQAIQWRCAKEHINFSIQDYGDLLVVK
jgi:hypothetical protein